MQIRVWDVSRLSQVHSTASESQPVDVTPPCSSFSFLSRCPRLVAKFIIDVITYSGDVPNAQPSHSPIRPFGPVTAAATSLIRSLNAQLATMIVPTNPGSVMEFYQEDPGAQNVNFRAPCPYSSKLLLLLNFFPSRVFSFP
jgi:hypothetical protein